MLTLIFLQYLSLLLMPVSGGVSLLAPVLSLFVTYIGMWKQFRTIHPVLKSHLVGQAIVGASVIFCVTSIVLTFEITQAMQSLTASDKNFSAKVLTTFGCVVFLYYYFVITVNFILHRKGLRARLVLPIPLTKGKYDSLKMILKERRIDDTNIIFKDS